MILRNSYNGHSREAPATSESPPTAENVHSKEENNGRLREVARPSCARGAVDLPYLPPPHRQVMNTLFSELCVNTHTNTEKKTQSDSY